jgi:hypothetical protein
MLEKIQGKPMLHKLRVIHIMEADYNLALKVIFGKRLMQNCERYGTLGDYPTMSCSTTIINGFALITISE